MEPTLTHASRKEVEIEVKRESKNDFIGIKVSPTQRNQIRQKCQKSGISVSEYMRVCAMQGNVYIYEGLPELVLEVRRIGVNLNQLTHQSHMYRVPTIRISIKRGRGKSGKNPYGIKGDAGKGGGMTCLLLRYTKQKGCVSNYQLCQPGRNGCRNSY